ncbi:MAG: ABC transporter permease [Defluviitaleaceae bacterium]|nr:ABC transporter permease [Defluviitaleaceae bacterium]
MEKEDTKETMEPNETNKTNVMTETMTEAEFLAREKELRKRNKIPGMWITIWREIVRSPFSLASFIFLAVFVLVIYAVPAVMIDEGYDTRIILGQLNLPPSDQHILGTDDGGRDMLVMLLLSTRNSFTIAVLVTIGALTIGYFVGLVAGFYGGYVDLAIMRLIDFIVMVPTIMVIIVVAMVSPRWDIPVFVSVMILFGWVGSARGLRARVLQESARDYVQASKTLGTPNFVIIFKKVMPNVTSFMMVGLILGLAANMGLETGLTVLGFGLPFGVPSIGRLIALARNPVVLANFTWQWLPAALAIVLMSLAIYGIGTAVSRAVDPRQRRAS